MSLETFLRIFAKNIYKIADETERIHVPDYTTKAKAHAAIGLDMQKLNDKKQRFLQEVEPQWIEQAKKNGTLMEL